MADPSEGAETRLPLSAEEEKVLALYDKLQELRLEIAILNAQHAVRDDETSVEMTADEAEEASNQLLDTRARYLLRNSVVESVLSANPILKAVHNGTDASPVERDLLSQIEKRDQVSIASAKAASEKAELRDKDSRTQSVALRQARQNAELADELMALVADIHDKKMGSHGDPVAQHGLLTLEGELAASRQRWRVMKGITSGVVVGSGVDWVHDAKLRDVVLDPEDED